MVKTLHFHGRRSGFNPWSGNEDPESRAVWPKRKVPKRVDIKYSHHQKKWQLCGVMKVSANPTGVTML